MGPEDAEGDGAELVLAPLDKLDEPPSLVALRAAVAVRLPRVDLPEILLELGRERALLLQLGNRLAVGRILIGGDEMRQWLRFKTGTRPLEYPITRTISKQCGNAEEKLVTLFRRYDIMKYWVDSGQFRIDDEVLLHDQFHLADPSYNCLGSGLADVLEAGSD